MDKGKAILANILLSCIVIVLASWTYYCDIEGTYPVEGEAGETYYELDQGEYNTTTLEYQGTLKEADEVEENVLGTLLIIFLILCIFGLILSVILCSLFVWTEEDMREFKIELDEKYGED